MVVIKLVEPILKPLVYAALLAVVLQLLGVDIVGWAYDIVYELVVETIIDGVVVW